MKYTKDAEISIITKLYNHRIAEVGRHLWTLSSSNPLLLCLLFFRLKNLLSLFFFTGGMIQSLNNFCGFSVHLFLFYWGPRTGHSRPMWPHHCWVDRKDHFSQHVENALPIRAQDIIPLLQKHSGVPCSIWCPLSPQIIFFPSCFLASMPPACNDTWGYSCTVEVLCTSPCWTSGDIYEPTSPACVCKDREL